MNLLIGGAGFVGSRLESELSNCIVLDKQLEGGSFTDITLPRTLISKLNLSDSIILLAAEHRDDVSPVSKYYETNVQGTQNVLDAMDRVGCKQLIFTSSVAVYGLNKVNPDENHPVDPFNHYGKSKWEAEQVIKAWYDKNPEGKSVTIIRPTVIFGEKNRGNVYNLLRQIASGKFLMIGKGQNKKSMAYVQNVADFLAYSTSFGSGEHLYNYVDEPDLDMNKLVALTKFTLFGKKNIGLRLPGWLGAFIGHTFDVASAITGKKFPVSSIRVKKFMANTSFTSTAASSGFVPTYSLEAAINRTLRHEFLEDHSDDAVFYSE